MLVNKLLIIIFLISLCGMASADNEIINITTSYDGYIKYDYMEETHSMFNNQDYIKSGKDDFFPYIYRSFIEFNISSIPKNVKITNVTFKYNGESHYVDCNVTNMTVQPSQTIENNIYNNIGLNTIYTIEIGFPVVGDNQSINLGLEAINDLQTSINNSDWFSIGIKSSNETVSYLSYIYTLEYAGVIPPPTLIIEYQVPPVSMFQPIIDIFNNLKNSITEIYDLIFSIFPFVISIIIFIGILSIILGGLKYVSK